MPPKLDSEQVQLLKWLDLTAAGRRLDILDYGCGRGRMSRVCLAKGHTVYGADSNAEMLRLFSSIGGIPLNLNEIDPGKHQFDIVLLCHVIEHFSPSDLLPLLDKVAAMIHPGGFAIIATPLLSPHFYDDFDHIKPYHPAGLKMVLGGAMEQVGIQGSSVWALEDIWFRRSPLRMRFNRRQWVRKGIPWHRPINALMHAAFWATGTSLGRTDGWMGLYRIERVGNASPSSIS